jgi:hypothetical protein
MGAVWRRDDARRALGTRRVERCPDHHLAWVPDMILKKRAGSAVVHVTTTLCLPPTHLPLKSSPTPVSKPSRQQFREVFKKTILDVSVAEGGIPKK